MTYPEGIMVLLLDDFQVVSNKFRKISAAIVPEGHDSFPFNFQVFFITIIEVIVYIFCLCGFKAGGKQPGDKQNSRFQIMAFIDDQHCFLINKWYH